MTQCWLHSSIWPYSSARSVIPCSKTLPFLMASRSYGAYRYFYSGPTFAITESDGVRIVGPDTCDFLQKVPGTHHLLLIALGY